MNYTPFLPLRPITVDALYSVHYFEYASEFTFAGESHDFWELLYVDKGALQVTAGDRQLQLTAGQAILHLPGEFHALSASGGTAPDLVVVSFSCASPEMAALPSGQISEVTPAERALMGRIVEESSSAFSTPLGDPTTTTLQRREGAPFGAEQRVVTALEELLICLIRRRSGAPEEERTATPEDQWLSSMEDYFRARLDRPLTLEQICRDNLIGRSQLQKRFHALTGGGAMAYFAKLKIETARRLIREGNLNVTQISARLGYQSVHYFSRHFKQHTGMSPSQYAKSVKMLSNLPGTPVDDRTNNV